MSTRRGTSRRTFLKTVAVATSAAGLTARSYGQVLGANNRLRAGIIGCGDMGGGHLDALVAMRDAENVDVVACCDVYCRRAEEYAQRVKDAGGDAKAFQYHEDMLAAVDLDYVVVATPEHSHAYLTLDALDAGKHVYCEKPMAYTVKEAQSVVERACETGLKVQIGVQSMSDDSYETAHAAIREGKLGTLVSAQTEYVRHYPAEAGPWRRGTDAQMPKPDGLDWERWQRPAKRRPWDPVRCFEWQDYRDYGGGIATGLWIHRITRVIRACGLSFPVRAAALGGIYVWPDGRDLPDNLEAVFEYPPVEGVTNGMTVHVLGTMANRHGIEHVIRGHNAALIFTDEGWKIISQESGEVVETHKKTGGEDINLHHKNHHAAIRDGVPLNCPPDLGMHGFVAVRMANLSCFKGRMVEWHEKSRSIRKA